jgi:NitT/TauT family transport system substrate-binding protein
MGNHDLRPTRRTILAGSLSAGGLLAAPTIVRAAEPVSIGIVNTISDVGFFVADAKGYFKAEDLDVKLQTFASSTQMIAPVGIGQLDVGAGSIAVGIYNSNQRSVPVRLVADKGRNAPGYGFISLIIRKELMQTGKFKSFADLKGLKIALPSQASGSEPSILNEALKLGGLNFDSCEKIFLPTNDQLAAFRNGGLDGSVVSEPSVSIAIRENLVERFTTIDTFYPDQQFAAVFFGPNMVTQRPQVGRRVIKAYLRGVRDYNNALANSRISGPGADEIVDIIARYSVTKDRDLIRGAVPAALNPDGKINIESATKDLAFLKSQKLVTGPITTSDVVDHSFVEAAVAELGPYKR